MIPNIGRESNIEASQSRPYWSWLSIAINFGYTTFGYYGFAPPPGGMPTDWWHGRTYILDFESMGGYVDAPLSGAVLFVVPAAVLCLATFLTTRSAITRTLALSLAATSALFAVAGFGAQSPWTLFSWRFTAVLALTGVSLAAAALAPLLANRWLRLSSAAQFGVYFPIFFCTVAAIRGATGTNEHLTFMMSPWPVFTTLGLDSLVLVVSGFLYSISLGVLSLARGKVDAIAIVGLLIALYLPTVLVERAWSTIGLPDITLGIAMPSIALAAVLISGCAIFRRGSHPRDTLQKRGFHVGLGATLVFIPIFSGHALAAGDYAVNRFVRAPKVIDALQQHIIALEFYPESLDDLVKAEYLENSPKPRIGFRILERIGLVDEVVYRYNEYGSSFVLEFDASFWVQCAYSGNYYFDDEEEELDDEEFEEEAPDWTCLNKSPALFEGGAELEDDDQRDYEEENY